MARLGGGGVCWTRERPRWLQGVPNKAEPVPPLPDAGLLLGAPCHPRAPLFFLQRSPHESPSAAEAPDGQEEGEDPRYRWGASCGVPHHWCHLCPMPSWDSCSALLPGTLLAGSCPQSFQDLCPHHGGGGGR